MSPQRAFLVKVFLTGFICFVAAAAFAAYLKPGMLVEFANLVLCG